MTITITVIEGACIFSERELMFTFAICYRLSVCLSVCLSADIIGQSWDILRRKRLFLFFLLFYIFLYEMMVLAHLSSKYVILISCISIPQYNTQRNTLRLS